MEGPKKITVPEHDYNSCQHCKYFTRVKVSTIGLDDEEFICEHPDRTADKLLWRRNEFRYLRFKIRIETPEWCPYLDSNNKRKVLVEKDMNFINRL